MLSKLFKQKDIKEIVIKGIPGKDGVVTLMFEGQVVTKHEGELVIKGIKGEKGDDGITPNLQDIISTVLARIPLPENGKDGISPVIDYSLIKQQVLEEIPIPKDGQNGSPDTGEQIIQKIKGLYSYKDLKDLPDIFKQSKAYGAGYLKELGDVSINSEPTNNQVLSWSTTLHRWIAATISTGATPGGSDTQVQFNDAGSFGGSSGFTYDKISGILSIGKIADAGSSTALIDLNLHQISDGTQIAIDWATRQLSTAGGVENFSWSGQNIQLFHSNGIAAILNTSSLTTSDKTFTFPNASGTFALTSDIGIKTLNGLTGATQTFATANPTSGASILSVSSSGTTHTFNLVGHTAVHPTVGSTFLYGEYNPTMAGGYNTAYGVNALSSSTIAIYNVAIAGDALKNATDATGVIAIGFEAAKSVVTGASNSIVIGTSNASLATTLTTSTLVGTRLATSASGVSSVIGVGDLMFQSITSSAINNLGIGFNLFNSITSDDSNYGVGKDIGDAATSITATYSFGESLFRNASGVSGAFAFGANQFNNLAFGNNIYGFGTSNMSGVGAGGFDAFLIGSGIANNGAAFLDGVIAIGTSIAGNNSDPYLSSVVIIGKNAGLQGTSLVNEIYIGESAGASSTNGTGNILIGAASGFGIISGQNNSYIGYQTGYTWDVSGSVGMGLGAMYSWNGNYSTFLGTTSGNFGGGDYIVGLGYSAFATTTSLTRSMALGAYAGATSSTDVTDVVLIGYGTEASSTTATNEIDFGSEISALTQIYVGWGGLASSAPAGGIVTLTPTATAGTNLTGSRIAIQAGNGTGTGGSGAIEFYTAPVGTTGTTANTPVKVAEFNNLKQFETFYGRKQSVRVVTAAGAVTVSTNDDIVVVNKGTGAATTVNLPAGVTGMMFTIKDGKGDGATNNLTITPAAGNIDGAGTFVMNNNYQSVSLVYNGTEWNII